MTELGVVRQDDAAATVHRQRATQMRLGFLVVHEPQLGIHRADPHEGDVVVKARGERQGMRADQGVIVAADIPRGHQHLIGAVLCEQQANIQGVGHHPQGFEPGELLRERQGRRTGVQEQRHAVLDQFRRTGRQTGLGARLDAATHLQGLLFVGLGQHRTAMDPTQLAGLLKVLEITPDRLFRYLHGLRQVCGLDALLQVDETQDFVKARLVQHGRSRPQQREALSVTGCSG
ncbi:hypothetical protein A4V15_19505 [Pseudomonas oryzihabitans]|uniref:Uncharacterized protein n=1 Tax=Pseudomonas oryzihabitans TaxID=47885 RepID=A0A178LER2_9PSED|nr:hypothetical protein A4V15_19505 [Pseudomonas oryzihabitans]